LVGEEVVGRVRRNSTTLSRSPVTTLREGVLIAAANMAALVSAAVTKGLSILYSVTAPVEL